MAASLSSSPADFPSVSHAITIKLDSSNYSLWLAQLLPVLKSRQLMPFVDGTSVCPSPSLSDDSGQVSPKPNPAYADWVQKDQLVLSWINGSLSHQALAVTARHSTARAVWLALQQRFASTNQSRLLQLRTAFFQTKRGDSSVSDFLDKLNNIADQLALAGAPVSSDDMVPVVMSNIGPKFENTVAAAQARETPISFPDLQALLLAAELRLADSSTLPDSTVSALVAARDSSTSRGRSFSDRGGDRGAGRFSRGNDRNGSRSQSDGSRPTRDGSRGDGSRGFRGGFGGSRDRGDRSFHDRGNRPSRFSGSSRGFNMPGLLGPGPSSDSFRPRCQICNIFGHVALDCAHRLNLAYEGRPPSSRLTALTAQHSQPWLLDSGANSHITNDLTTLTQSRDYHGADSVGGVVGGTGLPIHRIGSSTLSHNNVSFKLNNVLHCPDASTSVLSANRFMLDNNCYITLFPHCFYIQDMETGTILSSGKSNNGFYPLSSSSSSIPRPGVFLGVRVGCDVWHSRLGHPSPPILKFLFSRHKNKLPVSGNPARSNFMCHSCPLGKSVKLPFSASLSTTSSPLELIHSDVWSASNKSVSGFQYYVLFVDNFSRYSWIFPMKLKSEVFGIFTHFKALVENQFSTKIKMFQSDGGGEYTSHQFRDFLLHHGIHHRLSCPHHPEQNGLAERKHRHIVDTGLTLLAHASMPPTYWAEAMHTAVYLVNRLPSKVLGFVSPYQKLLCKDPDYSFLRTFGCACFPYLRPYNNNKLRFRSTKCVFLGYSLNHQGYRCLDLSTNRVFLSRHVVFDEGSFPFKELSVSLASSSQVPSPMPALEITGPLPCALPLTSGQPAVQSPTFGAPPPATSLPQPTLQVYCRDPHRRVLSFAQDVETSSVAQSLPTAQSVPSIVPAAQSLPAAQSSPPAVPALPAAPSSSHGMLTRSKTASLQPPKYVFSAAVPSSSNGPVEPTCFTQANKYPEWRSAMAAEFNALQQAGTWTLVPRTVSMNILPNKWVFRIKRNSDGSIQRYKARLVANGFHQQPGLDYGETFSPVVNHSTIRLFLALSVQFRWPVRQLDVQNAFLHGSVSEEVYMHQPRGFVDSQFPTHVCRLHRSLYGLKQAPRAWFQCFSTHLEDLGFTPSTADTSLFTYFQGDTRIYLLIYVDDILVTGNSISHIDTLITDLGTRFSMKDLGPVHYFLGMEVVRTSSCLSLSQQKYTTDLLTRTNMQAAKPVSTPAVSGRRLSLQDGDPLPDPTEYRSVVGALQYLTLTRPDINFAVNQVCQFLHQPTTTHWAAVKRILRYLVGTSQQGLTYKPGSLHLTAYSDADYAGDPDDRRSTGGYCLFLGSNLVSWSAKKQAGVSRSSTEAEYRQLAVAAATISWFRMLFRDLRLPLARPTLFCDNISTISLASNPVFHARTRHVEVDYHYVREKVVRQELLVRYISTHDQLADIFTKGLSLPRFRLLVSKLPVLDRTVSLRGCDK